MSDSAAKADQIGASMKILLSFIIALIASPAFGRYVTEEVPTEPTLFVTNKFLNTLAVTILEPESGAELQAGAPSNRLRIDEVLKGRAFDPGVEEFSFLHRDVAPAGPGASETRITDESSFTQLGVGDSLIVFVTRSSRDSRPLKITGPIYRNTESNVSRILKQSAFSRMPWYLWDSRRHDALVVTILEVDGVDHTNGNPPTGRLNVEESRGGKRSPGPVRFKMIPSQSQWDSAGTEMRPEWIDRRLRGPSVGDRLIVYTGTSPQSETINIHGPLLPDTSRIRGIVLARRAPSKRTGPNQLGVFFLIVVLPLMSFRLLKMASETPQDRKAQTLIRLSVLLPLIGLALYPLYESGISASSNIRVDMVIIGPALIMNVAVLISALVQISRRNRATIGQ